MTATKCTGAVAAFILTQAGRPDGWCNRPEEAGGFNAQVLVRTARRLAAEGRLVALKLAGIKAFGYYLTLDQAQASRVRREAQAAAAVRERRQALLRRASPAAVALVRGLCERPQGFSTSERDMGISRSSALKAVTMLLAANAIHAAKRGMWVRYFGSAQAALAFGAPERAAVAAPVQVTAPVAPTAGMRGAVDMSRARITVVPRPLGRYELPAGVPVLGGFAALGVGRYLPDGAGA